MRPPLIALIISVFLINSLGPLPAARADELVLPKPGVRVGLSPEFNPPMLKGIKVHPENPFRFDFILDQGSLPLVGRAREGELKEESTKLIKYFLASLTIPEKDLWVNLSPYEKSRIVPESFGLTEMGRDLLAQDYMLKQITASLIYPEDELGKKFWKRVYEEAAKKFGTTNIPVNTFNKVWIVPEKEVVYENAKAGTAYVVESKLKVMLEQDYLALNKNSPPLAGGVRWGVEDTNALGSQIVRELVIPVLTKEVNEGQNFAQLRQVYSSFILAAWYKKKLKNSILAKVYADQRKIVGVGYGHLDLNIETIYQQYLKAFKKGAYNYIKEEPDLATGQNIPRKYFSGGARIYDNAEITQNSQALDGLPQEGLVEVSGNYSVPTQVPLSSFNDRAMKSRPPYDFVDIRSLEARAVVYLPEHWTFRLMQSTQSFLVDFHDSLFGRMAFNRTRERMRQLDRVDEQVTAEFKPVFDKVRDTLVRGIFNLSDEMQGEANKIEFVVVENSSGGARIQLSLDAAERKIRLLYPIEAIKNANKSQLIWSLGHEIGHVLLFKHMMQGYSVDNWNELPMEVLRETEFRSDLFGLLALRLMGLGMNKEELSESLRIFTIGQGMIDVLSEAPRILKQPTRDIHPPDLLRLNLFQAVQPLVDEQILHLIFLSNNQTVEFLRVMKHYDMLMASGSFNKIKINNDGAMNASEEIRDSAQIVKADEAMTAQELRSAEKYFEQMKEVLSYRTLEDALRGSSMKNVVDNKIKGSYQGLLGRKFNVYWPGIRKILLRADNAYEANRYAAGFLPYLMIKIEKFGMQNEWEDIVEAALWYNKNVESSLDSFLHAFTQWSSREAPETFLAIAKDCMEHGSKDLFEKWHALNKFIEWIIPSFLRADSEASESDYGSYPGLHRVATAFIKEYGFGDLKIGAADIGAGGAARAIRFVKDENKHKIWSRALAELRQYPNSWSRLESLVVWADKEQVDFPTLVDGLIAVDRFIDKEDVLSVAQRLWALQQKEGRFSNILKLMKLVSYWGMNIKNDSKRALAVRGILAGPIGYQRSLIKIFEIILGDLLLSVPFNFQGKPLTAARLADILVNDTAFHDVNNASQLLEAVAVYQIQQRPFLEDGFKEGKLHDAVRRLTGFKDRQDWNDNDRRQPRTRFKDPGKFLRYAMMGYLAQRKTNSTSRLMVDTQVRGQYTQQYFEQSDISKYVEDLSGHLSIHLTHKEDSFKEILQQGVIRDGLFKNPSRGMGTDGHFPNRFVHFFVDDIQPSGMAASFDRETGEFGDDDYYAGLKGARYAIVYAPEYLLNNFSYLRNPLQATGDFSVGNNTDVNRGVQIPISAGIILLPKNEQQNWEAYFKEMGLEHRPPRIFYYSSHNAKEGLEELKVFLGLDKKGQVKDYIKVGAQPEPMAVAMDEEKDAVFASATFKDDYAGETPVMVLRSVGMNIKPRLGNKQVNIKRTGGIDLTSDKALQVQDSGEAIKFNIDPAMLQQLRNAPGFVPVIINIQPMTDLRVFLGLNSEPVDKAG